MHEKSDEVVLAGTSGELKRCSRWVREGSLGDDGEYTGRLIGCGDAARIESSVAMTAESMEAIRSAVVTSGAVVSKAGKVGLAGRRRAGAREKTPGTPGAPGTLSN